VGIYASPDNRRTCLNWISQYTVLPSHELSLGHFVTSAVEGPQVYRRKISTLSHVIEAAHIVHNTSENCDHIDH